MHTLVARSLGAVCACLLSASAFASDWPAYRGPHGDGIVTEAGLLLEWPKDGLKKVWSAPLGDGGGGVHAGAAVAGGKVIVPGKTGEKDVIYCFDSQQGNELWKFEYAATGQANWGTGPRATPSIAAGLVYTLSRYGQLFCLDAEKGTKIWERNLMQDFKGTAPGYGISAAPLVAEGRLICQPGGPEASLVALELKTGKVLWKSGSEKSAYAAPQLVTLAGVKQILAYPESGLVALDPASGKELWRYDHRTNASKNIPAPLVLNDRVVITSLLGFVSLKIAKAGETWKATKEWGQPRETMHFSSPVLGAGVAYFFHNSKPGQLKCMDLKDGSIKWSLPNMGNQQAQLLRLDPKHLLVQSDGGQVVLVEDLGGQGKEKARFQAVGATAFAMPAVADGRLFVRDYKTLVCYELNK